MPNLLLSWETVVVWEATAGLLPVLLLSGVEMPSPAPELSVTYGLLSAAEQPWSRASPVTSPGRASCPLISHELTLVPWKTSQYFFFPSPSKIATGFCCLAYCSAVYRWSQCFMGSLRRHPVSQSPHGGTSTELLPYNRRAAPSHGLISPTLEVLPCREWQLP